jgi:protein-S-isoprenylcysteine O-methyltransferase Ste14
MRICIIRSSPVQAGVTAVALFVLPLWGSPGLRSTAPWLGAFSAWLMLVSQPPVDPKAMLSRSGSDKWSAAAIFGSMIATQLAAVIEYRLCGGLIPLNAAAALGCGVATVTGGFALRLWAIDTLGRFFTSTVEVTDEQPIIRSGPYAWVRHPSYTGALLIAFGMLLMLRSGAGIALFALTVVPAYIHRIRVEEEALLGDLGESYVDYRRAVPAVVPSPRARRLIHEN